jgi:hypothetical protein
MRLHNVRSQSLNTTHTHVKLNPFVFVNIPTHSRQTQLRVSAYIKRFSGCIQLHIQRSVQHNVCMYVCMCVCMYVYVCVCMYVYVCVCMYVCVYVCMYVCMCVCVCMYVCMTHTVPTVF